MKLGFTLFQRVRGKLLPTSEAITLFEKRRAFIRTGQPAPAGRQPGSRSARQDHFRLSAKPGVKPGAGAGDRLYQQNSNLVMTLTTEHTETLVKNWICAR